MAGARQPPKCYCSVADEGWTVGGIPVEHRLPHACFGVYTSNAAIWTTDRAVACVRPVRGAVVTVIQDGNRVVLRIAWR
jgi:hypothetical protein